MSPLLSLIFGGDYPDASLTWWQVAARAGVVYVSGVAVIRCGKSRLLSHATPIDVILGFILGSLLSRGITGHAAFSDTVIGCAALVGIHWLFTAVSCRSAQFERLIKGHVNTLVKDGAPMETNMLSSHVSLDDLREAMRLQGFDSLAEIRLASKERNGEISIVQRDK